MTGEALTMELAQVDELRPVAELRPVVEFVVRGIPVSQGNAKPFIAGGTKLPDGRRVGGRAVLTTEANRLSSPLGAWRAAVRTEAQNAIGDRPPLQGPLGLIVTFVMPRPASAPKGRLYPAVRPDIDKLLRAIADALKGVVWHDDSQVVTIAARKVYGEITGCRVGVTHPSDELLAFDWGTS
jgi:crossover junction endodeoxyribonuclease RusA